MDDKQLVKIAQFSKNLPEKSFIIRIILDNDSHKIKIIKAFGKF